MEVEEVKKGSVQSQPNMVQRTLTAEEAALASIAQAEQETWLGLTDADIEDFSLSADPYPLPEEAKKLLGEYAFRWIERKIQRVDEVRNAPVPWKWWICNAITCPALAKRCDHITGAIHMRDQMLMIKPRWMFERIQKFKAEANDARERTQSLQEKRDGRFHDLEFVQGREAKITGKDFVAWEDKSSDDLSDIVDSGAEQG